MESNKNLRCWHYNECGHEKDLLCPATAKDAHRSCWLVAKTKCGGKVHGEQTQRIKSCGGCPFYIYIHLLLSRPPMEEQSCKDKKQMAASQKGRLSFM
jgi:hypothetical protein